MKEGLVVVVLIDVAVVATGALVRYYKLKLETLQRHMKTTSKSFFVAVAAFAVTASGVHAFGSAELLTKAGLSDNQVIAVQVAQELKATGQLEQARATLESAGVTKETMQHIREVAKEAKQAMQAAVERNDYQAFVVAIADSPLAEIITTESDFKQFAAAHELRGVGDRDGARELLSELGVDTQMHGKKYRGKHGLRAQARELLSDTQREALQVAHAANDKEAARAIFAEVGIDLPEKGVRQER